MISKASKRRFMRTPPTPIPRKPGSGSLTADRETAMAEAGPLSNLAGGATVGMQARVFARRELVRREFHLLEVTLGKSLRLQALLRGVAAILLATSAILATS